MKRFIALSMALALAASVTACSGSGGGNGAPAKEETKAEEKAEKGNTEGEKEEESKGEAAEDAIVLKLSDCHSPTATNHLAMQRIADEVKEQTGGRIVIEVYPSSQLGDVKASMEAIQMNTLDMAICNQAVLGSVVPECAILGAPFMFETDAQIANALNGELGKKLGELAVAQNINIACYLPTGFRNVFSTKAVRTLADFKGLKIRTMENPVDMGTFNSMGAIATPMGYSELFTAMQQNTVDAGENALSNIASDGFAEVAKYVTLTEHFYNVCPVLISNSAIDKIPEDLRDTFFKACADGAEAGRQMCMKANEESVAQLEEAGIEIIEIDRAQLKEATAGLYTEFADRLPEDMIEMAQSAEK